MRAPVKSAPFKNSMQKNSSGWLHAACTCEKKNLFFFLDGREWRWFFSGGWSPHMGYPGDSVMALASTLVGLCVGQKTAYVFDVYWLILFFCHLKFFFRHRNLRFSLLLHAEGWVWLPSTCDSKKGNWLPLIWAGIGVPVMWLPQKTLSFLLTVRLLAIFDNNFCVCICFCQSSSLASQCNPYVRKGASSVCCLVTLVWVRMSLHIEYGVVQRVCFECGCRVRVVCASVCVSLCLCVGVVSACVCLCVCVSELCAQGVLLVTCLLLGGVFLPRDRGFYLLLSLFLINWYWRVKKKKKNIKVKGEC